MAEPVKENSSPVNQKAKELLEKVKVRPDPNSLYCLQLAAWAVDERALTVHEPSLERQLYELLGWKPANAMRYLEEDADLASKEDLQEEDPVALASLVLEAIDSRLLSMPGYNASGSSLRYSS